MHKDQKVGVGIVTCSRPAMFASLLKQAKKLNGLDELRIVKNRSFSYGAVDPLITDPSISTCIKDDVGVGACKNKLMQQLLDAGCQHIFIVEDDVRIKSNDVLCIYIDTAEEFNLEHMNFCCTYGRGVPKTLAKPIVCLQHGEFAIDLYKRLSGVFEYFTANALKKTGLMDERYVNALEHCEHTYRLAADGFTTPFYAFADVHESWMLLEDMGTQSTMHTSYNKKMHAAKLFKKQHGILLNDVHKPMPPEVMQYLERKQTEKAAKA